MIITLVIAIILCLVLIIVLFIANKTFETRAHDAEKEGDRLRAFAGCAGHRNDAVD